ncbi:phosphodiester glycosidase family protein [Sphingobacterium bovistauri]|uniref:Phosphodiester glycosidase family protein n=1 Tax=Sphingobacterium bovistauri TaxID=2781959 RepID=A0ABS7Z836_9SPHI|nr:phosphodiester glycosidase family protein [Sphingobacterium bovistauri]MCA5005035.1 phosphodiester glycosidase family protein [Sphingobacterium bovistauri]
MKNITAFLFTLLLPLLAISQPSTEKDSIAFVQQQWQTNKIARGVLWKSAKTSNLFNSNQIINILEIDLKKNQKKLALKALPQSRELTSKLAKESNATVAINGGFFDMKNGGAVDFIKVDNQIVNHTRSKSVRANAYLAFDKQSTEISTDSSSIGHFSNIMLAGPMLISNNSHSTLTKNAFNDNRHPRTAIGIKSNKLVLITVDGRRNESQGMNLHELANLLKWYGCSTAMNLDGGGSTAMYIHSEPHNGIVNYPSDNNKFDHAGERKVSNIIYVTN